MGIEPILSAWKAEVLAIIRMAQISALDSLSAINKYGDKKIAARAEVWRPLRDSNPDYLLQRDITVLETGVLPLN